MVWMDLTVLHYQVPAACYLHCKHNHMPPGILLDSVLVPFLFFHLGMLGDAGTGFKNSKVYSQIGLGVLIKNENLVFNTFQLSIAFYPLIPGKDKMFLK